MTKQLICAQHCDPDIHAISIYKGTAVCRECLEAMKESDEWWSNQEAAQAGRILGFVSRWT